MEQPIVVNPNPDEIQPQGTVTPEGGTPAPAPGSKTDSELLLKSLQEEREKRRLLEEENLQLKSSAVSDQEAFSDEGKLLEKRIKEQDEKLNTLLQESAKKDVQNAHPALKENWEDFESFRADPENKGMNLKTAAKAYMIEKGLLDKPRVGLETTTGGTRQPITQGMTVEDVKKLREGNYKKYVEMLQKGQIPTNFQ
jgi:hypothetical protein